MSMPLMQSTGLDGLGQDSVRFRAGPLLLEAVGPSTS